MRIAFFGGSFDPPHRGHIAIARAALERLSLDRVLVAPVALQPLKSSGAQASFSDRLAMVKLAVAGDPRLIPSEADAPRRGHRPNYTIDTLVEIKRSLAPGNRLFCLTGADAFLSVKHWHRASELLLFCDFIVASRPGFASAHIMDALPSGIEVRQEECRSEWIRFHLARAGSAPDPGGGSSLYLLPDLEEDISATQIRTALANGGEAQTILEPEVAKYIRAHGLYQDFRASPEMRGPR